MLCKGCGLEQKDNQMFCSHCGTRNEMTGEATAIKKCTNCGKDFYREQRFCDACGGSLMEVQKEAAIIKEQEAEPIVTEAKSTPKAEPIAIEAQSNPKAEPVLTEFQNTPEPNPIVSEAQNIPKAEPVTHPLPTPLYQQVPTPSPLPTPSYQQAPNPMQQGQAAPTPLPPPYPMQANQLPPYQTPLNQVPMGQYPPGQLPPGQMLPRQLPPGQMAPGQMAPGQLPPGQMAPGQMAPGQMAPGQMAPGQMPPGQMPPGQIPAGHMPPGQLPAGHLPPLPPSQMPVQESSGGKKNKTLVVVIVAAVTVIFLGIGVFGAVKLISLLKDRKADVDTYTIDDYYDDIVGEYDEYSSNVDNSEDNIEDITEEDPMDTAGESTDPSVDSDGLVTEPTYDEKYTYTELPDAMSLDSDYRFAQMDYYTYDGVPTYRYWYNVQSPTIEDFHAAVDDYCVYLQSWNGYFYEEDLSLDQYQQTGSLTTYMSKNDMAMAVTAYTEADAYYVDVEIYDLSAPEENVNPDTYVNINYYLSGREFVAFDQYTEVFTESGIAFRVNDISISDLGNGYASVDVNMDLASSYTGLTSAYDDFLVLPMDSEGNILADASMIGYIYDANGYDTFPPFVLDTEYYDNYTVSFVVPSQTQYFTIYCTNLLDGSTMGPAYYVDMEIY